MRERDGAPLLLIDLAVPRDIEPACARAATASTLYDIDDLQSVVARNRQVREAERVHAEEVVEDEIQRFARWMGQLDVMPTISALREHGDDDRRAGAGRERRPLGERVAARPRPDRGAGARRSCSGCCTSRRSG